MATYELDKVIKIGEDDYNVNAKKAETAETSEEADQLKNSLTLTSTQLNNTSTTVVEFNGSVPKGAKIVPASGGRFSGRITVPSYKSTWETDKETILNYDDIKNTVLPTFKDSVFNELKNNTVLSEWDGEELNNSEPAEGIKSVGIITGTDANVGSFASKNNEVKYYSAYIYVADNGNIYFGTADSSNISGVSVNAENANTAGQLATPRTFKIHLESSTLEGTFDGTKDITLGVNGVLPVSKGGTGSNDLTDITVGAANTLRDASDGRKSATAADVIYNSDKIADIILGRTKVQNAERLDGRKLFVSASEPTNAATGDIWIKY